jgi:hypothetical protein
VIAAAALRAGDKAHGQQLLGEQDRTKFHDDCAQRLSVYRHLTASAKDYLCDYVQ